MRAFVNVIPVMKMSRKVVIKSCHHLSSEGGARSLFLPHKEEVWVFGKRKVGGILQVMAKYSQQNYIRNSSFCFHPQQLLGSNRMFFLHNAAQCCAMYINLVASSIMFLHRLQLEPGSDSEEEDNRQNQPNGQKLKNGTLKALTTGKRDFLC